MFLCAYCHKPSRRRETPILLLLVARLRRYINKADKESFGWEIVEEGPAAPSHKHSFRIDPTTKRIVPVVGFKIEPAQ